MMLNICKKEPFAFFRRQSIVAICTLTNLALGKRLCTEVCKSLNSLIPYFMQELFKLRKTKNSVLNKYKLNFPIASQVTYVTRSIRSFGPKIGNSVRNICQKFGNLYEKKLLVVQMVAFVF